MGALADKSIALGVSGGIAAYKAAALASMLVQLGARLDVILTDSARQFIQPLTFSAITHRPVHTDPFTAWDGEFSGHVTLAERTDLLIVAPATANTIARIALGLADDLVSLVALSTRAPLLVAPAMEHGMYHHPATRQHLQTLAARGAAIVGPEPGRLASGATGDGRMAAPESILATARQILGQNRLLAGKNVVITAGGTQEPLDPVRYVGNRSSGRMGYALANAARLAGAEVILITGPSSLSAPPGVEKVDVVTALQMQNAVEKSIVGADLLIMAAAVADFRPEQLSTTKIKKEEFQQHFDIRLVRNPDILAGIDQPGLIKVGFAAETDDLVENAERKLAAKGLSMIVANDAEATIGAEDSEATLLFADRPPRQLSRMSKEALASEIIDAAASLLNRASRPA